MVGIKFSYYWAFYLAKRPPMTVIGRLPISLPAIEKIRLYCDLLGLAVANFPFIINLIEVAESTSHIDNQELESPYSPA